MREQLKDQCNTHISVISELMCVGGKTPRMKVNKYSQTLKNLGEQITANKLNIHPHPNVCGREDPMDESKQ